MITQSRQTAKVGWLSHMRNPILFQGVNQRRHYFEGWYYKQVSADHSTVFSVIPGISLSDEDPHAFIQTILYREGQGLRTTYHRFETSAFEFEVSPFQIRIGNNHFSETAFRLELAAPPDATDTENALSASIELGTLMPIKTSLAAPNVMGFFAYMPFLECYHGLVSMHHAVSGTIEIAGETIDMSNGVGYIEKDWGCSFPKAYIWVQSNHFDVADLDFMCSVAHIPFMGTAFLGFLCNLYYKGTEYRFATYNGTRLMDLQVHSEQFSFKLVSARYTLAVEGHLEGAEVLLAPRNGAMTGQIKEGLSGQLKLTLASKNGEKIFEAHSRCCGMEVVWR